MSSVRERVIDLLQGPEHKLALAEVSLWLAKEPCPQLDVAHYLRRIAVLAREINARLPASADIGDRVYTLNTCLFDEVGIAGCHDGLSDPRTSYLHEVLDGRRGTPIALSILYLSLARELGLPVSGLAFPGYFLVRCRLPGGEVFLDPFAGGFSLSRAEVEGLADSLRQEGSMVPLAGWDRAGILLCLLQTLKLQYLQAGDLEHALWALDYVLLLAPDRLTALRERATLYERLECYHLALQDYRSYINGRPDAEGAARVRRRLDRLSGHDHTLH